MTINLGEVLIMSWKTVTGLSEQEILERFNVKSIDELKTQFCKRCALHMHEKGLEITPSDFEAMFINNPQLLKKSLAQGFSRWLEDNIDDEF